jgi:hypothetical protein
MNVEKRSRVRCPEKTGIQKNICCTGSEPVSPHKTLPRNLQRPKLARLRKMQKNASVTKRPSVGQSFVWAQLVLDFQGLICCWGGPKRSQRIFIFVKNEGFRAIHGHSDSKF